MRSQIYIVNEKKSVNLTSDPIVLQTANSNSGCPLEAIIILAGQTSNNQILYIPDGRERKITIQAQVVR